MARPPRKAAPPPALPPILTQRGVQALIARFVGQANVLTIPRVFIDLCAGNLEAALLLSQVLYWTERTDDPDGWFYKTAEQWQEELSLSEYQIRKARKVLAPFGLDTDLRAVHNVPILHYRLDPDRFSKSILQFLQNADPTDSQMHPQESARSTITETTRKDHPKSRASRDLDLAADALAGVIRAERRGISSAELERLLAAYREDGGDYLAWWQAHRDEPPRLKRYFNE